MLLDSTSPKESACEVFADGKKPPRMNGHWLGLLWAWIQELKHGMAFATPHVPCSPMVGRLMMMCICKPIIRLLGLSSSLQEQTSLFKSTMSMF